MIAVSQQLQLGLSRKAWLYNERSSAGIWIVLIQYVGRQGATGHLELSALCVGTIHSSKICRQHQITKREHWLWAGTICYRCVLPEHVIQKWERSRWTEAVRLRLIEYNLYPVAISLHIIRINSTLILIHRTIKEEIKWFFTHAKSLRECL